MNCVKLVRLMIACGMQLGALGEGKSTWYMYIHFFQIFNQIIMIYACTLRTCEPVIQCCNADRNACYQNKKQMVFLHNYKTKLTIMGELTIIF